MRKEVQKKFSRSHRIYFKHSRKLLLKHERDLKQEELEQVAVMLGTDANLSTAYFLKELLYRLLDETNPDVQKKKYHRPPRGFCAYLVTGGTCHGGK